MGIHSLHCNHHQILIMHFHHQQAARRELLTTIRAFFHSEWRTYPMRPRFSRFLTGPTGVGKTKLVRQVAEEAKLPLFEVSATNWILLGCSERGARQSWIDIANFCLSHDQGIIFLDEVDKLTGDSTWTSHLRVEVFSLLDQRMPQNLLIKGADEDEGSDSEELLQTASDRLENQMLIIGAGAFQRHWAGRSKPAMGFQEGKPHDEPDFSIRDMHGTIPEEIANRFASPVLPLPSLSRADYLQMAWEVCTQLPDAAATRFEKLIDKRVDSAVTNQTGCRWIMTSMDSSQSTGPAKSFQDQPRDPSLEI